MSAHAEMTNNNRGLDQHKSAAAIAEVRTGRGGPGRGQGRKAKDGAVGIKRINITIDPARADALRALGGGDLSLGIRRAADRITGDTQHQRSGAD